MNTSMCSIPAAGHTASTSGCAPPDDTLRQPSPAVVESSPLIFGKPRKTYEGSVAQYGGTANSTSKLSGPLLSWKTSVDPSRLRVPAATADAGECERESHANPCSCPHRSVIRELQQERQR